MCESHKLFGVFFCFILNSVDDTLFKIQDIDSPQHELYQFGQLLRIVIKRTSMTWEETKKTIWMINFDQIRFQVKHWQPDLAYDTGNQTFKQTKFQELTQYPHPPKFYAEYKSQQNKDTASITVVIDPRKTYVTKASFNLNNGKQNFKFSFYRNLGNVDCYVKLNCHFVLSPGNSRHNCEPDTLFGIEFLPLF